MRITVNQLIGAGADISRHYLHKLSSPVGHKVMNGALQTLFDTNMLRKAIEAKAYCHVGNENVSNGNLKRFDYKTRSILKAITKMEKQCKLV